eukprot:Hpha_TRINITY_DN20351_c0_g1::TRINITY_DN20351_c0_g1_i1::g.138098::m.138098
MASEPEAAEKLGTGEGSEAGDGSGDIPLGHEGAGERPDTGEEAELGQTQIELEMGGGEKPDGEAETWPSTTFSDVHCEDTEEAQRNLLPSFAVTAGVTSTITTYRPGLLSTPPVPDLPACTPLPESPSEGRGSRQADRECGEVLLPRCPERSGVPSPARGPTLGDPARESLSPPRGDRMREVSAPSPRPRRPEGDGPPRRLSPESGQSWGWSPDRSLPRRGSPGQVERGHSPRPVVLPVSFVDAAVQVDAPLPPPQAAAPRSESLGPGPARRAFRALFRLALVVLLFTLAAQQATRGVQARERIDELAARRARVEAERVVAEERLIRERAMLARNDWWLVRLLLPHRLQEATERVGAAEERLRSGEQRGGSFAESGEAENDTLFSATSTATALFIAALL